MRALGIALAVCSAAVLWPSTARADSIRTQAGHSVSAQNEGAAWGDDDDATFNKRSGLERSARFASLGSADVFADDRTSFFDQISFQGFCLDLNRPIIFALRIHPEHPEHPEHPAHPAHPGTGGPHPKRVKPVGATPNPSRPRCCSSRPAR